MLDKPISPLRRRMIDEMTARRYTENTRKDFGWIEPMTKHECPVYVDSGRPVGATGGQSASAWRNGAS